MSYFLNKKGAYQLNTRIFFVKYYYLKLKNGATKPKILTLDIPSYSILTSRSCFINFNQYFSLLVILKDRIRKETKFLIGMEYTSSNIPK